MRLELTLLITRSVKWGSGCGGEGIGWVVARERGKGRFAGPQGLCGPWEERRFTKCQDTGRVRQDGICQVSKRGALLINNTYYGSLGTQSVQSFRHIIHLTLATLYKVSIRIPTLGEGN